MATDKSLATLLRALHTPSDNQDASRQVLLLGSAATLLTLLSNPLNITLLASQLLSAPAVWHGPEDLQTCVRVLSVFNSASVYILDREKKSNHSLLYAVKEGLDKEEWVKAVVKGADDRSPRWKHILLLGGILLGFESHDRHGLLPPTRLALEQAIVKAGNLALQDEHQDSLGATTIVLILSYVFDLLNKVERSLISHKLLLPLIVQSVFFTKGGLNWGYFLGTMDADIVQVTGNKFNWSLRSPTFIQAQKLASNPLVATLGPLSRLAAFCIENVNDVGLESRVTWDLLAFSRSLTVQWRQNKLSEIDITEEPTFLHDEALKQTLPLLWQILKSTMFGIIVMQRSLSGRLLENPLTPIEEGPAIAIQTLRILRNLYFISSRLGQNSFSHYTFVYLTAIDILSKYPIQAETFLQEIKPAEFGRIPDHPHERCYDMFFLNTAEHFTLSLSSATNDGLLVSAASPYLTAGSDPRLVEIFEAAHSVMLAILIAPQASDICVKYIPFYVDVLFKSFPQNLSSRQFRVAVKTLVRIASPPFQISASEPLLSAILLETIRTRIRTASTEPLPPLINIANKEEHLSEQAVLFLAVTDSLPVLPLDVLEEWLPLAAECLTEISGQDMYKSCQQRFWDVLSAGEMDVTRAAICVTWWNTRGGRDIFLNRSTFNKVEPMMSGAIQEVSKL
ncbi:MAG: hypothetical protein MMC33_004448 [Icmadophila ericetorum]|nr:hypothetical protein [Icmadophila ericetorum]